MLPLRNIWLLLLSAASEMVAFAPNTKLLVKIAGTVAAIELTVDPGITPYRVIKINVPVLLTYVAVNPPILRIVEIEAFEPL